MSVGKEIVKEIDRQFAASRNRKRGRRHLGASMIGKSCARAIYYSWRWFYSTSHTGRLHRLWARGHDEEARLTALLASVGIKVLAVNPDTDEQFVFSAHMGHFGGSCDGWIVPFVAESGTDVKFSLPDGVGLFEAKTYNDKRFKALEAKGVLTSDPTYYNQMQTYMKAFGLPWALFIAVNKNDDTLYIEIVHYRPEIAEAYWDRAEKIVNATCPPTRVSNDASWWICKMCDFREICHKGETPQKNCRTCVYSEAVEDGKFRCRQFMSIIPEDFEEHGCDQWEPIV